MEKHQFNPNMDEVFSFIHKRRDEVREITRKILDPVVYIDFPEYVYHYTNTESLRSIIQSGYMWASSVVFLNDKNEMKNIDAALLEILQSMKEQKSKKIDSLISLMYEGYIKWIENTSNILYVISLSGKKIR